MNAKKTKKGLLMIAVTVGAALTGAAYLGATSASAKGGDGRGAAAAVGSSSSRGALQAELRCDLHPGDRLGFALRSRSTYAVSANRILDNQGGAPGGAELKREARSVEGTVLLRVLDSAEVDGARTLAAVMAEPHVTVSGAPAADVEADLATPVLFRMDRECRIRGFATSAPVRAAASNLWKLTLKMAEMVIPAPFTEKAWKAEQTDATGTFLASYKRADTSGGIEVSRARGPYTSLRHDGGGSVTASVLRGDAVAHYQPGAGWLRDLSVDEHVVLKASGATMADVQTTLALGPTDISAIGEAFFGRAFALEGIAFGSIDAMDQPPPPMPYRDRAPIAGLRGKTPAKVLADVSALLAKKPQSDFDSALNLLVQYLRDAPENARGLVDRMRGGQIDDGMRSVLFLGLSLAGGREAHAALVEALGDRRLADADHLRALAALAGTPDPDRGVTDALMGMRDHRAEAALALGTLAHNPAVPAEEKQRILTSLSTDLAAATTASARVDALTAVGNAGDPSLRDRVTELAGSDDPMVSAAAYRALQKMGALPAPGALLDAYGKAKGGSQQAALAESLAGSKLGGDDLARAIAMLQQEPPSGVRATLINLLGASAAESPAAKAALVAQFRVEKDPALLSLIGRFVEPFDLN